MDGFVSMLGVTLQFLQMPITVYGFTFSFWDIILFSIFAGLIFKFLGAVLNMGNGGDE